MGSEPWRATRARVVRNAIGVGVATGAAGLSFGAISTAAGLSVPQTCALSILMFTGASQFALVGVIGLGGNPFAGLATAVLLGTRNGLYGLRLASLLRVQGRRKLLAAQLVIDESTAMAIGQESEQAGRLGFWVTGLVVFGFWNLATVLGAVAARSLADPVALGLDAAVPAAFLALLAPRMRSPESRIVALTSAAVALISVPFVPVGVPVLIAALVAVAFGLWTGRPGETGAWTSGGAPGEAG